MFRGPFKIVLGILFLVVIIIAGYVFYLYQKGGTENYRPPVQKAESPGVQILNDIKALSLAVDAYYTKNLKYPEKLEELKPEFVEKIPVEPGTGKSFRYETDGLDRYRITLTDPSRYGMKELFIENGEITQK